ncbi:DUF4240 domain-containing protein [Kineosporia sp. J2-2]|uniref:DUF4240 domain-containing protein n=1 Tax=Kineosporia corallincola TaxID=2835133 RepID=A0ABS5TTM9_9ACTN|nr:DUF4240 domain-containing protein [Kineosporia corallincola]MBT0774156.1 DUF4240 domain-containing protein [Kineosporia corallincola]
MDEVTFWEIIAAAGEGSDAGAMSAFRSRLSAEAPASVEAFGRLLIDKLYALDTLSHYEQAASNPYDEWEDPDPDLFVAVRCAIVLAGPHVYGRVLNDPQMIASRPWPGVMDSEYLVQATDRVFAALSVRDGSLPGTEQIETGSNPAGFHDAVAVPEPVPGGLVDPAPQWAGVGFDIDDPAVTRTWAAKKAWPAFDLTTRAALARAAAVPGRREALQELGVDQVEFEVALVRSPSQKAIRVSRDRSGSLVWVSLTAHLPLKDCQALDDLEQWAHDVLDAAFEEALKKLSAKAK